MECLQYLIKKEKMKWKKWGFKPCYKWNAFNTLKIITMDKGMVCVLNLVINGMPSIL